MEERRRPDFRRHTLPPVSRRYLWRILIYIFLLGVIIYIALSTLGKHRKVHPEQIHEVHGVQIEPGDSLQD